MELSRKHWFAKLYFKIYDIDTDSVWNNEPKNFCRFFWTTIIAILLLPLYFLTLIIPKIVFSGLWDRIKAQSYILIFYFFLILCGQARKDLGWGGYETTFDLLVIAPLVGLLVLISIIIVALLIIGVCAAVRFSYEYIIEKLSYDNDDYTLEKLRNDIENLGKKKEPSFFSTVITGIKEKMNGLCPRITWKD